METGASIKFTYDYLPGMAVSATQSQIDRISSLGFVRGVFPDTLRRLNIVGAEILTHVEGRQDFDHTYNLDLIDAEPSDVKATGKGVIVAVLDTGLIFEWREFLREESVLSEFGRAFVGAQGTDNENKWQHDTNSHGLAVAATIVGFKLDDKSEEGGFLSEPLTGDPEARVFVRGVAPDAKIIPVKVCEDAGFCFLSSIIKGIDYVIGLVRLGNVSGRVVINLSLGGPSPSIPEELIINIAISHGIVVVAAAGNEGEAGLAWPGAYPQVISAAAVGWKHPFGQTDSGILPGPGTWQPDNTWWFSGDPPERKAAAQDVFVASFSSRVNNGLAARFRCLGPGVTSLPRDGSLITCRQELDVSAPGRRVLLPFLCVSFNCAGAPNPPADPLPPVDRVPIRYFFISGTSFSSPHTAGVVALLLEVGPTLTPHDVEKRLKDTATRMPSSGTYDEIAFGFTGFLTHSWDNRIQDATGAGLLNAKAALSNSKAGPQG